MDREPEALFDKYAKLVPKSPVEAELAMSKVHISKNWKVPPRSKPGRRRGVVHHSTTLPPKKQEHSPNEDDGCENHDQEKKKKQNRDAQRAYRERRANRIQELESTVETLQNMVKMWQKKCKAFEEELKQSNESIMNFKQENMVLRNTLEQQNSKKTANPIPRSPRKNINKKSSNPIISPSEHVMISLDPLLQNMIKNFKPMKAVTLKRREKLQSSTSPLDIASEERAAYNRISPFSETSVGSEAAIVKCGFCTDSTTCVCKELEVEAEQAKSNNYCSGNSTACNKCSLAVGKLQSSETISKAVGKLREPASLGLLDKKNCKKRKRLNREPSESMLKVTLRNSVSPRENVAALPNIQNRDDSYPFYEITDSSKPNTMDPNFKPGSCENCQMDPTSKAFCEAVYGPTCKSINENQRIIDSRCGGLEPGSCVQCQMDPQSKAFCKAVYKSSLSSQESTTKEESVRSPSGLIPVSDAYQRVRKYMQLRNSNDKDSSVNYCSSSLALPFRQVASELRVSGKQVESRSVDDAIRELDKNAMG